MEGVLQTERVRVGVINVSGSSERVLDVLVLSSEVMVTYLPTAAAAAAQPRSPDKTHNSSPFPRRGKFPGKTRTPEVPSRQNEERRDKTHTGWCGSCSGEPDEVLRVP